MLTSLMQRRCCVGSLGLMLWHILWHIFLHSGSVLADEHAPAEVRAWLTAQDWQRDTDAPILTLGQPGDFDDTHLFAPMVARVEGRFLLWYCGSRGSVAERVFRLGLATGLDGRRFDKLNTNPVFALSDGERSVLTPTLLREVDGTPVLEAGQLRMWFSATSFEDPTGRHTLHETFSRDGVHWIEPSPALLENVYAPSIIKSERLYEMWYVDVGLEPWGIRRAESADGRSWRVDDPPVVVIDQAWESNRLFYPTVIKIRDTYLMWYGSYWSARPDSTALGFAVSLDGKQWYKHSQNPVLRPDVNRSWESHYVTSQSVVKLSDGSFRMWYASRTKPPFVNKYFAINTALWATPPRPDRTPAGDTLETEISVSP